MSPETDNMINAIKNGIDNNATDAPAMSIDPKSNQVSVVGDPNKINETKGEYKLTFVYPADELSVEDKSKMKQRDTGEYETVVDYYDRRVKPLHRTKIAMHLAGILTNAGVILDDGSYTTDGITERITSSLLNEIDTIAEIAGLVLDIPEAQRQYLDAYSLLNFFIQLLDNEPNIIKESANFLEPSLVKQMQKKLQMEEETKTQNTPQN